MEYWHAEVVDWLERAALGGAHTIAIEDGSSPSVKYGELNRISKAVAAGLQQRFGLAEGDRVAIIMRKASDTLIAYYAVLRAGAVYVPIDAGQPMHRTVKMLWSCGAKIVLIDESLRAVLEAHPSLPSKIIVVGIQPTSYHESRRGIEALSAPSDVAPVCSPTNAYLLYTSGSTGDPKAVVITHQNLVDFVNWCSEAFAPGPHDRFATLSPLHFSLSVFNIYVACKHGAAVCLIDDQLVLSPQGLCERLEALETTVWFATPWALLQLAESGALQRLTSLRLIMWGGEALQDSQLTRLSRSIPRCRCVNVLGCTEAHIVAIYEIPEGGLVSGDRKLPVGIVASRFRWQIVDDECNPVRTGSIGELWISGPGVCAGYWSGPSHAFVGSGCESWFRTGDLVMTRGDGNLVYHGRRDRVIKRRGNRIDLGEVEACLRSHSKLSEGGSRSHER